MNQHAHKCHIWGVQIITHRTTKGLTFRTGWINISRQLINRYISTQ